MARSVLALVMGYTTTVMGVALMGWLMSYLFPTVGPGRVSFIYYHTEDLFWISAVAGIPAIVSGYLTARLARRAPVGHALALVCPIVILLIVGEGPSSFFDAVFYSVGNFFFTPPQYRASLAAVLYDLHVVPFTIGVLVWSPLVVFGGYLRFFQMGGGK